MFRSEESKKEKVKTKTQNEKIVEADMDIWYYTHKKVVRVRTNVKVCNVSSRKNNL